MNILESIKIGINGTPSAQLHVAADGGLGGSLFKVTNTNFGVDLINMTQGGTSFYGNSMDFYSSDGTGNGGITIHAASGADVPSLQFTTGSFGNTLQILGTNYPAFISATTGWFNFVGNVAFSTVSSHPTNTRILVDGADATASNYGLIIRDSTLTELLSVRNDGFVGIGASPASNTKLLIDSEAGAGTDLLINATWQGNSVFRIDSISNVHFDSNGYGSSFNIKSSNATLNLVSDGGYQPAINFYYGATGTNLGGSISSTGDIVIIPQDNVVISQAYLTGQALLHVQGIDHSPATFSFIAQDDVTNRLFTIRNDGQIGTGNSSNGTISIGFGSGIQGNSNLYVGASVAPNNTGLANVGIGTQTFFNATGVSRSVALGAGTLAHLVTATYGHTALGYNSMYTITGGDTCVAVGSQSLYAYDDTNSQVAIGSGLYGGALGQLRKGGSNVAVTTSYVGGPYSGGGNVFIGPGVYDRASSILSVGPLVVGHYYIIETFGAGDDFTNVGAASNANGIEFIATGTTPATWSNGTTLAAGTHNENVAIGDAAGQWTGTGSMLNVYLGSGSGYANNDTGIYNTGIYGKIKNTFLGANTGSGSSSNGSVFIGYNAGQTETSDNKFILSTDAGILMTGKFDTGEVTIPNLAGSGVRAVTVDATGKLTTGGAVSGTVASKFAITILNSLPIVANTAITLTHGLGTTDISVSIWDLNSGELASAKINNRTTNTVDVTFASVPVGDIRVVIIG